MKFTVKQLDTLRMILSALDCNDMDYTDLFTCKILWPHSRLQPNSIENRVKALVREGIAKKTAPLHKAPTYVLTIIQ